MLIDSFILFLFLGTSRDTWNGASINFACNGLALPPGETVETLETWWPLRHDFFPRQESPQHPLNKNKMHSENASYLESIMLFRMFRSTKKTSVCWVRLGEDCLNAESRVNGIMGMPLSHVKTNDHKQAWVYIALPCIYIYLYNILFTHSISLYHTIVWKNLIISSATIDLVCSAFPSRVVFVRSVIRRNSALKSIHNSLRSLV